MSSLILRKLFFEQCMCVFFQSYSTVQNALCKAISEIEKMHTLEHVLMKGIVEDLENQKNTTSQTQSDFFEEKMHTN